MIFEKDPKTRYVDMAIYIDHHIYSGDFDENLVYQYLYFLIYMLAKKKKYFTSEKSYDDFSIWLATKMYVRLTDPRQFDDNEKLGKVTSILNYLKGILFAKKIEYNFEIEYQTTLGKFNSKYIKDFDDDALSNYYRPSIEASNRDIIIEALTSLFEDIPAMFYRELKKSPYKNNKLLFNNLYISCLLTFIKSTTIPNYQLRKMDRVAVKNANVDITKYSSGVPVEVVLWGLPNYLKDYVKLLFNRIKNNLIEEIKDSINSYSVSQTELNAIINSNYTPEKED